MSQRGKCGAADGTGPIADGVKEPDMMDGGVRGGGAIISKRLQRGIKMERVVRKMTGREEVNASILGGWTRREMRRIGVYAWGGLARRSGGGGR